MLVFQTKSQLSSCEFSLEQSLIEQEKLLPVSMSHPRGKDRLEELLTSASFLFGCQVVFPCAAS